jgi:hypothetical protein
MSFFSGKFPGNFAEKIKLKSQNSFLWKISGKIGHFSGKTNLRKLYVIQK